MRAIALLCVLTLLTPARAWCDATSDYRIVGRVPVSDARWDYAAVDPVARRLYLGRFGGVLTLDLDTRVVTPVLVPSALIHGVVPLGAGRVMATEGEANRATLFDGLSGEVLARYPTGREPDAIVFDPRSGLIVTADSGSRALSLIDLSARRIVGHVSLPGIPEFLAVGPAGVIFDNLEDRNAVAVVDLDRRRVRGLYPLKGCHGPTGLAYDAVQDLLLSVCRNGVAKFLDGRTGEERATLAVGAGPDAALFDEARHLAFVPAGGSGTLAVISVANGAIRLQQTLVTQRGSRTAALDPSTGRLYVPAARFAVPPRPGARASALPGSFEILIIEPGAGHGAS
ncbi:MAG TPA: hypothetical protein VKT22_04735 [Steroidobacteraceae bacterium]|nr:hypothetical protein [Steroidobacteraceae bacterium]